MAEEVIKFFNSLLNNTESLNAIIVTDREGVSVLQVKSMSFSEQALKPQVLATAPQIMEQACKLGFGQTKTVIAMFENFQMISFNKMPLTVTVMADKSANIGQVLAMESDINAVVQQMKHVVENGS